MSYLWHSAARFPILVLSKNQNREHRMAAYVIAEVEVHDPVPYEEYRRLIGPTLAKYGGWRRSRSRSLPD